MYINIELSTNQLSYFYLFVKIVKHFLMDYHFSGLNS